MKKLITIVLAAICAAAAPATRPTTSPAVHFPKLRDDAPEAVKWLWRHQSGDGGKIPALQDKLDEERQKIDAMQAGTVDPKHAGVRVVGGVYAFGTKLGQTNAVDAEKTKAVQLESQLSQAVDAGMNPVVSVPYIDDPDQIKVGMLGTVGVTRIVQVVDDHTVRVEVKSLHNGAVYDAEDGKEVWITGVDTSAMSDDQKVMKKMELIITGTKSYETALGARRTELKAEKFDLSKYLVE